MTIWKDNQGCISIATNQKGMSARTKHVETRFFAVRQFVDNGDISVLYIPTAEQLVDIFTKPLGAEIFTKLVIAIGLKPTQQ